MYLYINMYSTNYLQTYDNMMLVYAKNGRLASD